MFSCLIIYFALFSSDCHLVFQIKTVSLNSQAIITIAHLAKITTRIFLLFTKSFPTVITSVLETFNIF